MAAPGGTMVRFLLSADRSHIFSPPAAIFGAAGTAALFATALVSTPRIADLTRPDTLPTREVVYMLPLLPAPHERPVEVPGLRWVESTVRGSGLVPTQETGMTPGGAGEQGTGPGRHGTRPRRATGESDLAVPAFEPVGSTVFIATAVDRPVTRDPASAAPAYPAFLEHEGIEGAVTVQYVVDTTGTADSTSLVVSETTHPAFAESVRAALPRMRFQPAELQGHRVRQMVRQEFRFVMPDHANSRTEIHAAGLPHMN
jgi:TonB family protein